MKERGKQRVDSEIAESKVVKRSDRWTFFSNHGHVIIYLTRYPSPTVREIALAVGITERAVISILTDLENYGCVTVNKSGRRNYYTVNDDLQFRHPVEKHVTLKSLLKIFKNEI
jgi:DNA-binding MarR family transcriptional regulator